MRYPASSPEAVLTDQMKGGWFSSISLHFCVNEHPVKDFSAGSFLSRGSGQGRAQWVRDLTHKHEDCAQVSRIPGKSGVYGVLLNPCAGA